MLPTALDSGIQAGPGVAADGVLLPEEAVWTFCSRPNACESD
jgi:hypothetical protein